MVPGSDLDTMDRSKILPVPGIEPQPSLYRLRYAGKCLSRLCPYLSPVNFNSIQLQPQVVSCGPGSIPGQVL